MAFTWDSRAGRYRDDAGRFVPEQTIRDAVDMVIDHAEARLTSVSERLMRGELTIGQWQREIASELKALNLATAAAARGGWAQMTASDYGTVGARLRIEYRYLRDFAKDIEAGRAVAGQGLLARVGLYAQNSRTLFARFKQKDAKSRGLAEEAWILHPSDHCEGCPSQAAKGWVPLGTLPAIGSQPCRVNCKCTKQYRGAAAEQAA